MRPSATLTSALLLSSTCLAWPFNWDTVQVIKREIAPILKRQTASYNLDYTPTSGTQGDTAPTASPTSGNSDSDATSTGGDASTTGTQKGTGTDTGKGTITPAPTKTTGKSGSSGGNSTSATTQYDPRLPAGGISMITPNPYTTEYYKIQDYITLKWNYTSVSQLPSAIDILAYGALNSATYTFALNESVAGPTQAFTIDTSAYQNNPNATVQLLTQTYTLIVHDAAKDVSATPSPGYLGTANQFTFGMYLKQPYRSESDGWQCVTCSGAMASIGKQTLLVSFGVAGVTVLSFTWFAGVAGLW